MSKDSAADREKARLRAEGLVKEADAAEQAGNLAMALAALDRAASTSVEVASGIVERRKTLRTRVDADAIQGSLRRRFNLLAEAGDWFGLRRELAPHRDQFPDVVVRLEVGLAHAFPSDPWMPPSSANDGVIDVGGLGVGGRGEHVILAIDEAEPRAIFVTGKRLAVVGFPSGKAVSGATFPSGRPLEPPTSRVLGHGDTLVVFDSRDLVITTYAHWNGDWPVDDRADLNKVLGSVTDRARLAAESHYDIDEHRLVVVLTDATGQGESRVIALDASHGGIIGEDRAKVPMFGLRRIHGSGEYLVHRPYDPRRPGQAFHYAIMDSRAKIRQRVVLPELEAPFWAYRKLTALPDGSLLGQYTFRDPVSGRPIEHGAALIRLHADHTLLYQNPKPGGFIPTGHLLIGLFEVVRERNLFVLPWRTNEATPTFGLTAIDITKMETLWSASLPAGTGIAAVLGHLPSSTLGLLVTRNNRMQLVGFDLDKRELLG